MTSAARHKLETLKADLEQRLERIRRDRQHIEQPLEQDFAEQAVMRENDEVLDSLETTTALDLHQVRYALQRMDEGVYGICDGCGRGIEPGRLEAIPQATRCLFCT